MKHNKNLKEVLNNINSALDFFYEKDIELLELGIQERAISHKFACYLQKYFEKYDVDCEYDKDGSNTKILNGISECSIDRNTDRILPDIIIHKRKSGNNFIVFEIKSKQGATECDIKKLELMTKNDGQFKYSYGFFIKFDKKRINSKLDMYINGKKSKI